MKVGIGAWIFASFVLLAAIAFAAAELRLFRLLRRIASEKHKGNEATASTSRVATYFVILFALSVFSFPATTFSLMASFAVPWQFLWPAAGLFLANGIIGLLVATWFLAKPRQQIRAVIVAAIVASAFSYLALSFLFVRYR